MNMIARQNIIERTLLFLFALMLFLWGLGSREIIGFESRFYVFALEMWQQGLSWFPTTYHLPYPDYPGASTWLIYGAATLLGGLNKFSAVLPSAIAAAFTVVITYMIGALYNKGWGLYATCFLLLSITFLKTARALALDMYPTLITAAVFYLVCSADIKQQPKRAYWVFPLLMVSFAFRGPIGIVIPTSVVAMYYLGNKKIKNFFISGFLALALLIICTTVLLMLAYQLGGDAFLQDVLRMEILGRMDGGTLPWYFYFSNSLNNYALTFPLALLSAMGIGYYSYRSPHANTRFLLSLIAWMLIILLGMSIPGGKKIRYVLPMLPAAALLAGYIFIAPAKEKYFYHLRSWFLALFLFFPTVIMAGLFYLHYYASEHALNFSIHYPSLAIMLSILQGIIIFYHRHTLAVFLCVTLSFCCVMIGVVEKVEWYLDQSQQFVRQIETLRSQQQAQLAFYKEKPDNLPIKYRAQMLNDEQPLFMNTQAELKHSITPTFFITSENYFAELQGQKFKVIAKNKLGHVPVVVFTKA